MKSYNFKFGGDRVIKNGKSNRPDCINLEMGRHHAWDLVYTLIHQLSNEEQETIHYEVCGNLFKRGGV